jgi:hypothetical protein
MTTLGCDTYTGSDGKITMNGVTIAVADFEITMTRNTLERNEVGKFAKITCPTRLDVTGTLTKAIVDGHFLAMVMGRDSDRTSAASTTLVAITGVGVTEVTKLDADIIDPGSASRIKVTTAGTIALGGDITIYGTDPANASVSENITVTTTAGSFYGMQIFKTVKRAVFPAMGASANVTLYASGGTGTATTVYTSGSPGAGPVRVAATASPTTPSRLKYITTAATDAITATSVVVVGTDVNDEYVSETIKIPVLAISEVDTQYGQQIFKTVESIVAGDMFTANTTLGITSSVGITSVKIGKPTYFSVSGMVHDDANDTFTYLAAKNCYFTSGRLPIGDIDTVVDQALEFKIVDPQNDLYLGYKNETG